MFKKVLISSRALIFKDSKILLVSKDKDKWVTPGGMMDEGESAIDTLKRELKEELGLELERGYLTYVSEFKNPNFKDEKVELHFVCDVSGAIELGSDPDNMVLYYRYFSKDELKSIKAFPEFIKKIDFSFKQDIYLGRY